MKNVLLIILTVAVLALGSVLVALLQMDPSASDMELDRDRAALAKQISDAKSESEKYSGGAVKAFIDLRIAILITTDAMLQQKRATLFRRISLNYPVNFQQQMPGSSTDLESIIAELGQAEKKADASHAKALSYSGGLVQGIALMTAETDELSVSALRLKFYSVKHGFPILPVSFDAKPQSETIKGKIVKDKEGL
jgi:hypothetical protein